MCDHYFWFKFSCAQISGNMKTKCNLQNFVENMFLAYSDNGVVLYNIFTPTRNAIDLSKHMAVTSNAQRHERTRRC